ncbi:hypothetical protein L9F63_000998, partial [Diploptera punctata]
SFRASIICLEFFLTILKKDPGALQILGPSTKYCSFGYRRIHNIYKSYNLRKLFSSAMLHCKHNVSFRRHAYIIPFGI